MNAEYTPIKVGKTGKVVHAGYVVGTHERKICGRTETVNEYRQVCTVTNTHNINSHPHNAVFVLPSKTPITCKHCLAIINRQ